MSKPVIPLAAAIALAVSAAWAQAASPEFPAVLPLASEAAPALSAAAPLPEALARGVVIIQHRVDNARLLALFGPKAAELSPRVAHLHVSVDGQALRWAHTSADPVIVVGLAPGRHTVLLELASPVHGILTSTSVPVLVPEAKARGHQGH